MFIQQEKKKKTKGHKQKLLILSSFSSY